MKNTRLISTGQQGGVGKKSGERQTQRQLNVRSKCEVAKMTDLHAHEDVLSREKAVEQPSALGQLADAAEAKARLAVEAAQQLKTRLALRSENLLRIQPGTDSSLKKVTPFLKKVREKLCDETKGQLLIELPKLNLSKYVEEVAVSVSDAKLKTSDLPAAVAVCSCMHRSYPAFAPALLPHLLRHAALQAAVTRGAHTAPETEVERSARLSKKRGGSAPEPARALQPLAPHATLVHAVQHSCIPSYQPLCVSSSTSSRSGF